MKITSRLPLRRSTSAAAAKRPAAVSKAARPQRFAFFRETWAELKKVTWPTWEQARNLSIIVIIVSGAIGLFLAIVDLIFNYLVTELLLRVGL